MINVDAIGLMRTPFQVHLCCTIPLHLMGCTRGDQGSLPPVGAVTGLLRLLWPKAMEAQWTSTPACRRAHAPFLGMLLVWLEFVFCSGRRGRRLLENGIRFSLPSPRPGDASSIVGGMWKCVSGESRRIRSVFVFGGSSWIRSSFVCFPVSTDWIFSIYDSLDLRRLLFWFCGTLA